MKYEFRVQGGGFCGVPREETTNCLEIIPAPAVVLSQEEHDTRQRKLKANYRESWKREYYDPMPCILAAKED